MLLKIVGSLIVLLASSFLGYVFSRDCRRRPEELRQLQGMLQLFENQINYLSNILTDAFEEICKHNTSVVADFFKQTVKNLKDGKNISAEEAWELAVKSVIGRTALNAEDEAVLFSFGKMLGKSDLEGQLKNIRMTIDRLKLQEMKAEEEKAKNEKMYRQLGILSGIAIVIVLL